MRTAVELLKRENLKLKARAARDSLNQKLPQLPRLTLARETDKHAQNILRVGYYFGPCVISYEPFAVYSSFDCHEHGRGSE